MKFQQCIYKSSRLRLSSTGLSSRIRTNLQLSRQEHALFDIFPGSILAKVKYLPLSSMLGHATLGTLLGSLECGRGQASCIGPRSSQPNLLVPFWLYGIILAPCLKHYFGARFIGNYYYYSFSSRVRFIGTWSMTSM